MAEKIVPQYMKISIPRRDDYVQYLDHLMDDLLIPGYETQEFGLHVWIQAHESEKILKILSVKIPPHHLETTLIAGQDWNQKWKENFKPLKMSSRFWVSPSWDIPKVPYGEELIIIHPGQAFGTGTHESTQLAIQLLEKYYQKGNVTDMGCGSGILSIAAYKLGARDIRAYDIDDDFIENMEDNLKLNAIDSIHYAVGDALSMDRLTSEWTLINIEKRVIMPLLHHFFETKAEIRFFILSGLLIEDAADVVNTLRDHHYLIRDQLTKGEWTAVLAEKGLS